MMVQGCETPEEMLSWAEEYAESVVEEHDLDVDLALVDWDVSHRAKRRAGAVIGNRLRWAMVGFPIEWDDVDDAEKYQSCTVRLTWRAYEELGHVEMEETIRHELIHVEQVQRFGKSNHGLEFERRAEEIDAPLACGTFTAAKYILYCSECREIAARRHRKSKLVKQPGNYQSECCEATLTVKENPNAE